MHLVIVHALLWCCVCDCQHAQCPERAADAAAHVLTVDLVDVSRLSVPAAWLDAVEAIRISGPSRGLAISGDLSRNNPQCSRKQCRSKPPAAMPKLRQTLSEIVLVSKQLAHS